MIELKALTVNDIKFDEDNIYFAHDINIHERLLKDLTEEECGYYLVALTALEFSVENDLYLQDGRLFTLVDIREVLKSTSNPPEKGEIIYNKMVDKGFIKEEFLEEDIIRIFYY